MATIAIPVFGGSMKWSTSTTGHTAITEAKKLLIPTVTTETIDVTNLDSPNGFREKIFGLKDGGEFDLECNYSSGLYTLADGYFTNETLIYFKATMKQAASQTASADTFDWTALVQPVIPDLDIAGAALLNIKMTVTGALTFTAGS